MIIDKIKDGLFALRLQAGGIEPESETPLVQSLLTVWKCQAGFLIQHTAGTLEFGGYYLFAHAHGLQQVRYTDTILRNREIIVFNTPGQATLIVSPIASTSIQHILDSQ